MSSTPDGGSIDLAYYLDVPRRRWRVVVASVLVALLGTLLALQVLPTTYTATAEVTVAPLSEALFPTGTSAADTLDLPAEADLVESGEVAERAADRLSAPELADEISASIDATGELGDTVLTIEYAADDADDAVQRLNTVADAYLDVRQAQAEARREARQNQLEDLVRVLNVRLNRQLAVIAEAQGAGRSDPEVLEARTKSEVLAQQITEANAAQLTAASVVLTPGFVTTQATGATTVPSPSGSLVLASGLSLGLLVGLLLAFVREKTDKTVCREAVVRHLTGAPVLANVGMAAHNSWLSPQEEQQMQLLRSRLLAGIGSQNRVLFIVGSSPHQSGAGMARHLAESLARGGQQVSLLLIGGTGAGLEGEALSDTIVVDRVGMGVSGVELADLVQTPMVTDRIDTMRIGNRFTRGHAGSDLVIVAADAPLDRASVIALAGVADGVLVVVDTRVSRADELDELSRDIRRAGSVLVGTVLSRSKRATEASAAPQRALAAR